MTSNDKPGTRDTCGIPVDQVRTDSAGARHYRRERALGSAAGPAEWSDEHDCNPACGHHLAALCRGCGVCTACDGCYCYEAAEW